MPGEIDKVVCRVLAAVERYDRMRLAREKTKPLRSAVVVGMKVRCRWPTIPRLRKSFLLGAEKKWVVVLGGEFGVSRTVLIDMHQPSFTIMHHAI